MERIAEELITGRCPVPPNRFRGRRGSDGSDSGDPAVLGSVKMAVNDQADAMRQAQQTQRLSLVLGNLVAGQLQPGETLQVSFPSRRRTGDVRTVVKGEDLYRDFAVFPKQPPEPFELIVVDVAAGVGCQGQVAKIIGIQPEQSQLRDGTDDPGEPVKPGVIGGSHAAGGAGEAKAGNRSFQILTSLRPTPG